MSACRCSPAARDWTERHVCSTCGRNVLEEQLAPGLIALLTGGTGLVLWRNPRGFDDRTKTRYGLAPGAADYIGLWAPTGRFVGVELKTVRGRHEADQRTFRDLIVRSNGVYALVRCDSDARALLAQLRQLQIQATHA